MLFCDQFQDASFDFGQRVLPVVVANRLAMLPEGADPLLERSVIQLTVQGDPAPQMFALGGIRIQRQLRLGGTSVQPSLGKGMHSTMLNRIEARRHALSEHLCSIF